MRTTNNSLTKPPDDVKLCGNGQCARVVRHMRDYGSITAMDAVKEYGIMRLAARVADLKKLGYTIDAKFEKSKNRYGETINYVRYYLREENHE